MEQPGWLSAYAQGWAANVFNFFGDAKTFNQGPGPRPAAPRGNGPNQGVNPLDELMHAVDMADRTGNVSIAALSTNRFAAKEFGEFTEDLATGMQAAEIAASMAFEPIDLAMALAAIAESPGEWTAWASMLPFVPSAVRMLPSQATGRGVGQNLGREYDSGTLKTNLTRLGARIPEGAVAHHVVGNSLLAQKQLHPMLRQLGFDLNDAANGIMLDESFHKTLGTDAYREHVVNLLSDMNSIEQLYEILDDLKRELLRQQDAFRSVGAKPAWSTCNEGTR